MKSELFNGLFCEENGYFCPYMDRSGTCIATSCKRMTDILINNELERKAQAEREIENGRILVVNDILEEEIYRMENESNDSESDLLFSDHRWILEEEYNDNEGSRRTLYSTEEQDRRSEKESKDA